MPRVARNAYIMLKLNREDYKVPLNQFQMPMARDAVKQYGQKIGHYHKIKIPVIADTNPDQNNNRPVVVTWIESTATITSRSDGSADLARIVLEFAQRHPVWSINVPGDD